MFFLLPWRQSGPLKSFSAPIIAPACIGRGRGLHSVAAGRIHADVNLFTVTLTTLSNHLAWKLSPFVSTLNFPTQEQKLKLHEMWGGEEQIPADKARPVVLWPCWPDIICLYLALCHSPSVMKREPLHCCKVETGSLVRHRPVLQIFSLFTLVFSTWKLLLLSRVCWTGRGVGGSCWTGEQNFCYLGSALLPALDGVTACHGGRSIIWCKTLLTDCGAWWGGVGRGGGEHQGLPLFYLLFSLSFQSRDQSAVHTRAPLASFPLHLSIQQPVII